LLFGAGKTRVATHSPRFVQRRIDPTRFCLLAWKLMMLPAAGPSLFVKNEKRLG
jgi:hypothetical protein